MSSAPYTATTFALQLNVPATDMDDDMEFSRRLQLGSENGAESSEHAQSMVTHAQDGVAMAITGDDVADAIAEAILINAASTCNSPAANEDTEDYEESDEKSVDVTIDVARRVHFPIPPTEIDVDPLQDLLKESIRYEWQEETLRGRQPDSWAWVSQNTHNGSFSTSERPETPYNYPTTPSPTRHHRSIRDTISRLSHHTPNFHRIGSPDTFTPHTPGSPLPNVWSSISTADNAKLQGRLSQNASRAAHGEQWIWISEDHPEREDNRRPGDATLNVSAYLKRTRSDATLRKKSYNMRTGGASGRTSPLVNEWGAITTAREGGDGDEEDVESMGCQTVVSRMGSPVDRCQTPTLRRSPVKRERKKGLLQRTLLKTFGKKLGRERCG
ncbi:hypothetical protein BDV96DRAFT_647292 [Lophiotrema nucula]|uniref:Uncharacterized protein n=1 Tax=Lophiotrema nucula TaxID=690887 RepID=A0A6A5Z730_9PLEO|nr:hypothetical protein BDV96DRAFT_647292 [Lophiotrema nucula]